jgi:hypothetical protein
LPLGKRGAKKPGRRVPAALPIDGLAIGEGLKPPFPVIVPHAAVADAAEGQRLFGGAVHCDAVDRNSAGSGVLFQFADVIFVGTVIIQRQRSWCMIDLVDHLVQVSIGENLDQRSEDLFFCDGKILCRVDEKIGRDLSCLLLGKVFIRVGKRTKIKLDVNMKPEVIFVLANHNPRSSKLRTILNDPEIEV